MAQKLDNRSGQVIVLSIAALVVFAGIAMLAIDTGHLLTCQARLQNAADAAVLAAMAVLADERAGGASEAGARSTALAEALAIGGLNAYGASVDVAFGTLSEDGTFNEEDESVTATAVEVRTSRDSESPAGPLTLFFGPVFGLDSADVAGFATAGLGQRICGIRANLSPFAVHEDDVAALGVEITFYDHGQFAPGCFGLLNLDGGSFNTPEVEDWILNGYDDEVRIDPDTGYLWIDGGTGFRAAIKEEMQTRIGDCLIVAVYDQVSGQGSNAEFRIISFAALTVTEVQLTGGNKHVTGRVEEVTVASEAITAEGAGTSPNLARAQLVR